MAEEPEVIQRELDETRHALAEKLEQIGEKISGTVENVSETVSHVTETVENVTEAVEGTVQNVADAVSGTVEGVKDTVSAVGERASETVAAIKEAFNLPEQVRHRPWLWFGGSVVLGFVGGKFLFPQQIRTTEAAAFARGKGYTASDAEAQGMPSPAGNGRSPGSGPAETTGSEAPSMLGGVLQNFGAEINKLKGLALGTLFGVARDMISRGLPESLKDQVVNLINGFTEKAGGQTIQQPIFDESSKEETQESGGSKGAEHEDAESNPAKMDRPLGAVERKGKAGVGRSDRR